ncbi:MAG: MFS transporter [Flavobacteriales bacterium]|jgi:MFS family permease|nr:MFS transporter [Flavobacteriales bacterium]|tara:strand:- start:212 stop:1402 length:1191 start_codon:yes stop_codon:yes gene_type:complete
MLFKRDELKLLWPFYLYYLIFGLSTMIMPFMIIYFVNLGFSFFQIALITSAFGITMFLFEVPTGAFADGFSRKYSVILGFFITAIAVILIPLMTNFYLLLLMWVLAGIGMTFVSGAEESWVIDNLNKFKRNDLHQEFFIKSGSLAAFGAIFAPFVGALLVKIYSIKILWFVFGFGFLLNAFLLMVFGQEHYKPKKLKLIESIKQTYLNSKKGLKFTITHKVVFLIILAGIFTQLMVIGDNGWQPFLVNLGMAEYQLGYMYSIMAAIVMVMPFLSRLFVKFKPKNAISIIVSLRMILLFSLIFIYPPLFFLAAIVFIMDAGLFSMKDPIIQTYFHKFIPKKIRATVVSSKSMFSQLVIALTALIAGVFLDLFGPQKVLAFGSLFGIIAIILYQKIKD